MFNKKTITWTTPQIAQGNAGTFILQPPDLAAQQSL
jgi:hypothetical protein